MPPSRPARRGRPVQPDGFSPGRPSSVASSIKVNRKLYLTCLWPGLPELWWRGRLTALPAALAFAIALNLILVAKFIYPEWLSLGLVRLAGWLGLAAWAYLSLKSIRELPNLLVPRAASKTPDRFMDAHLAYLRGQWREAEACLTDCLAVENRDPPALLLLAGVYRHTRRWDAAERLLDEIRLTEAADRWWLEVETERKRLDRDRDRDPDVGPAAIGAATAAPAAVPLGETATEVSPTPSLLRHELLPADVDRVVTEATRGRAA